MKVEVGRIEDVNRALEGTLSLGIDTKYTHELTGKHSLRISVENVYAAALLSFGEAAFYREFHGEHRSSDATQWAREMIAANDAGPTGRARHSATSTTSTYSAGQSIDVHLGDDCVFVLARFHGVDFYREFRGDDRDDASAAWVNDMIDWNHAGAAERVRQDAERAAARAEREQNGGAK